MNNFEEFLKEKANEEKSKFILPKTFEDNIDNLLENLETNNKKFKIDKKFLVIVASLIMVTLIGIGYNDNIDTNNESGDSVSQEVPEVMKINTMSEENTEEVYSEDTEARKGTEFILNVELIDNITIKDLNNKLEDKFINNRFDIEEVVDSINSMHLEVVESQSINAEEWDFLIEIKGIEGYTVKVKDTFIKVNESIWYKSSESIDESLWDL